MRLLAVICLVGLFTISAVATPVATRAKKAKRTSVTGTVVEARNNGKRLRQSKNALLKRALKNTSIDQEKADYLDRAIREFQDPKQTNQRTQEIGQALETDIYEKLNEMTLAIALVAENRTGHAKKWAENLAFNALAVMYRIARVRAGLTKFDLENGATNAVVHLAVVAVREGLAAKVREEAIVNVSALLNESGSKIANTPAVKDALHSVLTETLSRKNENKTVVERARWALKQLNSK